MGRWLVATGDVTHVTIYAGVARVIPLGPIVHHELVLREAAGLALRLEAGRWVRIVVRAEGLLYGALADAALGVRDASSLLVLGQGATIALRGLHALQSCHIAFR